MKTLKILVIFVGILNLLATAFYFRKHALNFKFVDEEDNLTIGKYVLKGEKIYDDIISNHQPLTYILSSNIQGVTHPENGYFLITRHREFMISWAIGWSIILFFSFGLRFVIFSIIFELTKIHILGNLFLAEGLTVYPLAYLLGYMLKPNLSKTALFILGISSATCLFLLLPIWPAIIFSVLIIIYNQRKSLLNLMKFFLPSFLLVIIFTFIYASLTGYFFYTLFVNLIYTVPGYQNESPIIILIKSFFSPLLVFFSSSYTPTQIAIELLSLIFLINLFILIISKKFKKAILIIVSLALLNIRFIYPGTEGYSGFHLLPWFGAFIFFASYLAYESIKMKSWPILRIIITSLLGLTVFISLKTFPEPFKKEDSIKSYYINYSTHLSLGDEIKIMKSENDTLFVSPNAWLIYWEADIKHLPKLYGDYTWMAGFKPLQQRINLQFETNPPTFFYCDNCKQLLLEKYLNKYQMMLKNNSPTNLYVLSSKVLKLTKHQLSDLQDLNINF